MASATVEDYLKKIYILQARQTKSDGALVPMGKLASVMGVSPGTATAMIKTLFASKLVYYEPRSGVRLTASGEQLALHVLRRHRLVEQFLVQILDMDWSEVHDEAEDLEHAVSDAVLDRMDKLLGHPQFDPHGDPIPTSAGQVNQPELKSLSQCIAGSTVRIKRILDQDTRFLQFIDKHGLTPGVEVQIKEHDPQAQAMTLLRQNQQPFTIGTAAADKIYVDGDIKQTATN